MLAPTDLCQHTYQKLRSNVIHAADKKGNIQCLTQEAPWQKGKTLCPAKLATSDCSAAALALLCHASNIMNQTLVT